MIKPKPDLLKVVINGRVKETGKHFEISDSDYLNITLDSSEEIDLWLESMPEMITLRIKEINKNALTASTEITISGLKPNTTYHKYENHYYNHVAFTTDESGKYSYNQDISKSHIIFIQPRASTYFLKETGWEDSTGTPVDPSIASWDSTLRIATLEIDILGESIEIEVNDATLDGQGHTTTGSGTGNGIFLSNDIHNVIIKNFEINNFSYGIYFSSRNDENNILNNTISDNRYGIYLDFPNTKNNIENNTITANAETGIFLLDGNSYNNIENNTISGNGGGIHFSSNNDRTNIVNNTISGNYLGIFFDDNNDINIIIQNCILNNTTGIHINSKNSYNQFENNNFINSTAGTNAFNNALYNTFNSNYWDNWSGADPYPINPIGHDNSPLLAPWDVTPPTTTINLSGTLGDNDWYRSYVQVTLSAEDIYPCSLGVENTLYSFDGTVWNDYTSPFSISAEGITTVYYYSFDSSGNVEDTKTNEVKIDKTPPEIIINAPADGGEYVLDETILADWSVSDTYSGVASSSGTVPSGAPIDTSSSGEKYFTVTATDYAGNSTSQTTKYYVKTNVNVLQRGFMLDFF